MQKTTINEWKRQICIYNIYIIIIIYIVWSHIYFIFLTQTLINKSSYIINDIINEIIDDIITIVTCIENGFHEWYTFIQILKILNQHLELHAFILSYMIHYTQALKKTIAIHTNIGNT